MNDNKSPALRWRNWKFRICGTIITVFSVWLWIAGDWNTIPLTIGTVSLIIGIAVFMMGSPETYNSMTDAVIMVAMDKPRKTEEFYEAFKNVKTPLGSGWLGHCHMSSDTYLFFGPDQRGQLIHFHLTKDGVVSYIGYSFLPDFIKDKINDPLIPCEEDLGRNTAEHLCYHADMFLMMSWLKESIEYYLENGQALPFRETRPSEVFTFTEDFKLTGQHFELRDHDGELVYEIDGTVPLRTLRIYDTEHTEIFRMTKKIVSVLATYSFHFKGEPYGEFKKKLDLVRDQFAMDTEDGRVELIEYAGTIGHNFKVTLDGRMIGAIMDNLDISLENFVFDNAFIIVYEKEYLPLLTAMAVMAARELARDEEGGASNWIGDETAD